MPESSSAMTAPSATLHAVQTGPDSFTGYLYDAEGHRVAKGTLPALTCDPAQLQVTAAYFIGPDGETMTEIDGNGSWVRTEVSAAGQFLATYTPTGLHLPVTDWLGTKRLTLNPNLAFNNGIEETCASFPFGDQLNCTTPIDASPKHFTGKERDTESGLDYVGARYYNSAFGRWMSPDWSAKIEPVPYAKLDDPQSLNLYAYEFNNPLGGVDADGHGCGGPGEAPCPTAQQQIGQDPTLPTEVAPSVRERVYDSVTETAETVGNAIAPKTTADLVSLALMVPTDGLGGLLPEAGAALSRVMELSGAMGKTADYVTLAVTETQEGTKVVSSSENALRPAVKALLKDGEVAAKGAGHAEVTGVNTAKQMGLTPTGVAASRGICPSCATYLKAAGVAALSALRQYF